MPIHFGRPGLVRPGAYSDAVDEELRRRGLKPWEPKKMEQAPPSIRDVMIVLLGSAMLRMETDRLTVGQTAELLLKMLEREGYKVEKK
jgi:hypothetical protein